MDPSPSHPSPPHHKEDWKSELRTLVRKKPVIYTASVLLALVIIRSGYNWWSHRRHGDDELHVTVVHPEIAAMDETLKLPGNIEAIEQASLYAHIGGYLRKIYVDEGDHVKKGQLLAEIDAPDAIQEYRKAKAVADLKETTLKRYQELLKERVISQQEFDTVEAEANEAKAHLDNAQANVQYTRITAPFAGSIARRFNYPGDLISGSHTGGGKPIFVIVNESELRVIVNVPQIDIAKIEAGRPVDIHVDALPQDTFHGTVSRLDALLDEATKTQRVLIDIQNTGNHLRAGMFGSVVLHVAHHDKAVTVPAEAVDRDGDHPYVYVVRGGKVQRVSVTIGLVDTNRAEVIGEVRPDDQVIARASGRIPDGTAVKTNDAKASKL